MYKINKKDLIRFFSKVRKTNQCWEWIGGCFTFDGYGQIGISGQMRRAHRVSWIISNGKIPKNIYVLHRCNNRKCVNPKHLYLGTQWENMRDAVTAGHLSPKGEKNGRSILKKRDIKEIRSLYKSGYYTQIKLADVFKVGRSTISHILRGYTWSHV